MWYEFKKHILVVLDESTNSFGNCDYWKQLLF